MDSVDDNMSLVYRVPLTVTAQLGSRRMNVREVLDLAPNAVVELDRAALQPIDVFANEKLVARGEIVVVNDHFGVRITEVVASVAPPAPAEGE